MTLFAPALRSAFGAALRSAAGRTAGSSLRLSANALGLTAPSGFSFGRNSVAYDFDATGTLQSSTANSLRSGYDPTTLQPQGWLLEGGISQLVPNPRAEGGGAQAPTGWTVGSANAGLTVTWPGQVTIAGVTCQLLRFQGTMSANGSLGNIQWGSALPVTAAAGVTSSIYASVYAGSLSGITVHNLRISNATVATQQVTIDGTFARKSKQFAFASDVSVAPQMVPTSTSGAAIDITYALGAPNLTAGSTLYNVILPPAGVPGTTTTVTDSLSLSGAAFTTVFGTAASGFVVCDAMLPQAAGAAIAYLIELNDGTLSQRLPVYVIAGGLSLRFNLTNASAGVNVNSGTVDTATAGTPFRIGIRWGNGVASCCVNGGTIVTLSPGTLPVALSTLTVGNRANGAGPLNGRIRGIWAGSAQLSDAKFAAACSLGANLSVVLS